MQFPETPLSLYKVWWSGWGDRGLHEDSLQLPVEAEGELFADQSGSLLSENNVTVTQTHGSSGVVNEAQCNPPGPGIRGQ